MRFDDEDDQDAILELTDQVEENEDGEEQGEQAAEGQGDDDEIHLAFEGEDDGNETELVRRLRDQVRTAHGKVAELERKVQPEKIEVGEKPTLEGCDWDAEKFEEQLSAFQDRKRKADAQANAANEARENQNKEFERLRARHMQRAAVLKIPNFEALETKVVEALGPELAGAALVIADDSAKLVGALGQNPAALARIQDEPNPLLKLKLMMKLESKIVAGNRKPPAPEASTIQRGSAPAARVSEDKKLAALEKKARESGDRTELVRYKKTLNQKAA